MRHRVLVSMGSTATGYVRTIQRREGPVFYAKLKLADGTQPQRRLGRAWLKRSRPPEGFLTPGQADARLQEMLDGKDPSVNIAPSNITLGMACAEYLHYAKHDKRCAPSTVKAYLSHVDSKILPWFGKETPVEEIATDRVEALRDDLLTRVSARTTQHVMIVLHGILHRAVRKGWVGANEAAHAERVKVTYSGEFNILEPEQVQALARHASPLFGALFIVGAFTGLRCPGEIRALRWSHVDFGNRIVHVVRNYVLGEEGTTKGKRVRSVPLSDQAMIALDGLSKRDLFALPGDLVFCNAVGEHLAEDAIRTAFYTALLDADLGHLRWSELPTKTKAGALRNGALLEDPIIPYDLRHTFGTLAVRKASLADVQAWMGHRHITTTMRYVHYVPQHDAAAKLTAAFSGAEASVAPVVRSEA
jgi:integrase